MRKTKDELGEEVKSKSIKYLAITLIFIMLPYIVKLFAFTFTELPVDLIEDFTDGAFIMYAVSLLAPIWYTVETVMDAGIKKNNAPVVETFITIIVSMAAYVVLSICKCANVSITTVPVIIFSAMLMIWSIYLAYEIHMDEITVTPPDQKRTDDENALKNNIERLEKGQNIESISKGVSGDLDISGWDEEDE